MGMSIGTVSVSAPNPGPTPTTGGSATDNTPTVSGSGAALYFYNALVASYAAASPALPPVAPTVGSTAAPYSAGRPASTNDVFNATFGALKFYQQQALVASGLASAVVGYIQANATAHVTSQSLGRTPNPNNAATAILAPVAAVDIPIT